MTRYVLCRYAIGQRGQLEITEERYNGFASDIQKLVELCDMEEKYNAFIDNYFELERGLLEDSLRAMVYSDHEIGDLFGPKHSANRRVINLLTAVKLYLDSLPQHANRLLTGEVVEKVKKAPSRAYDSSLAYRVMEALRNYSQHEAFPIQGWSVDHRRDKSTEPNTHWASVQPSLTVETLAEADKFKASVLEELKKLKPPIFMKPLIREYMEKLAAVHEEFRTATKSLMDDAQGRLNAGTEEFVAHYPGKAISVVALPVDKRGLKAGEPVYLTATVTEYLPLLQQRVGSMVNFARRRVEH